MVNCKMLIDRPTYIVLLANEPFWSFAELLEVPVYVNCGSLATVN